MPNQMIQESFATGEEVNEVVLAIEEVIADSPRTVTIIALLSLVLMLMNPDITPEELQVGVRDTSQFVCMICEGAGTSAGVVMN